MNEESENKNIITKLLKRYKIAWIQILPYNSQANGMIKVGHKFIVNTLFKMTLRGMIVGEKKWISHLPAVLMAERTTVRVSTGMISFHILYEYDAVLSIKLNVLIWQTLAWNMI